MPQNTRARTHVAPWVLQSHIVQKSAIVWRCEEHEKRVTATQFEWIERTNVVGEQRKRAYIFDHRVHYGKMAVDICRARREIWRPRELVRAGDVARCGESVGEKRKSQHFFFTQLEFYEPWNGVKRKNAYANRIESIQPVRLHWNCSYSFSHSFSFVLSVEYCLCRVLLFRYRQKWIFKFNDTVEWLKHASTLCVGVVRIDVYWEETDNGVRELGE